MDDVGLTPTLSVMKILSDILEFRHPLGNPPYCYRWVLNLGLFSLRLHHWIDSDIHEHSHPYWMLIFCFLGSYLDISDITDKVVAPCIRFRKPSHKHKVITGYAWTFLITGPKIHKWYLFKNGKRYRPNKYFN